MQSFQEHHTSAGVIGFQHQPLQMIGSFYFPPVDDIVNRDFVSQGSDGSCPTTFNEQIFSLDSSMSASGFVSYDSASTVNASTDQNPFIESFPLDNCHSLENISKSSPSVCSIANQGSELRHKLRELELSLLGPESDMSGFDDCWFGDGAHLVSPTAMCSSKQMMEMAPKSDLKQGLIACAKAIASDDTAEAAGLMNMLEKMVSVTGDPIERLGAYVLEGLRARIECSGSLIYRKLDCNKPTGPELMSYMQFIYEICPYWKFAYASANAVISEAMANELSIHIIDFQIAQGSQWVPFIQALARRPGGAPLLRITGIDDSQSIDARGGGLEIVGRRLLSVAKEHNVAFEFHDAAVSTSEVELQHLMVRPGEALAVNFPYVLHHVPDESVSTQNHRDRLLRLVKSLSPKVVTLVEQESNTNTSSFSLRFLETMDHYTAMLESIDVAISRDDKQRISAEQHCVARDIVNVIACEGTERMERHELFGKWRSRFRMAGFDQLPLSRSVVYAVMNMLKMYHKNYRMEERDGALFLGWIGRFMYSSSAWR